MYGSNSEKEVQLLYKKDNKWKKLYIIMYQYLYINIVR